MESKFSEIFKDCYIMQSEDLERFANTLADGFSQYELFQNVCGKEYSHDKMTLFWSVSIALYGEDVICIADSKEINSVLVYVRPKIKEPSVVKYLKSSGLKMLYGMGMRSIIRLQRIKNRTFNVAKRYKSDDDGYILCFATRIDKQGQKYGKHVIETLMRYLDMSGEGCYLETFRAKNVDLYKHFSFELKAEIPLKMDGLTLYAMHRPARK
ncbi:MAG: hypothetical protein J6U73_03360 [Alistipes sp.]|nr:hypothetical protein [Alistipes sp.]